MTTCSSFVGSCVRWQGNIELRNIEFTYPNRPNQKIYGGPTYPNGYSLKIKAGETVALVGPR